MKDDNKRRVREQQVPVSLLEPGMYVARLDRPWTEVPFMFQGFVIEGDAELAILHKYCQSVYIDVDLSPTRFSPPKPDYLAEMNLKGRKVDYAEEAGFDEELPVAAMVFDQMLRVARTLRREYRECERVDIVAVNLAVKRLVASVLRNPDPMHWMLHTRDDKSYEDNHLVGNSVLMAEFGRYLGLPESTIRAATVGALLADLGKQSLPNRLLNHAGKLSQGEFELVKEHVYYSLHLLEGLDTVSRHTVDTVAGHHERLDGSGYPGGLKGHDISPFARMLAIADSYDAITSARPFAAPLSSQEAIKRLFAGSDVQFEQQLVERFVQCLSNFPTGSIVELNSGEVGVVYAQNRHHRLRPRLRLVCDHNKHRVVTPTVLNLAEVDKTADGKPLFIQRLHPPGSFDVTREIYLP